MNNEDKILEGILKSIHKIKYGEIVITVHNSQVVQIERREKERFDLKPTAKMEAKN
ncbi:MAG: YezD family protein [Candidatus Omnitrophica bacterium]|nr:YezD family protein [Candidatus Omnitrophota bacterium]